MKLLVVVQRYGTEILGGAETLARGVVEHLAEHLEVEVATTTALDYTTWKEHYPAGETSVDGIRVRRFPVIRERAHQFQAFSRHVLQEAHTVEEERRWIHDQGPETPALLDFLAREGSTYDAALFFGYLYEPTVFGLPLVADRAMLMPAAHDEAPIRLPSYRALFHLPRAYSFSTVEERDLVHRLFPLTKRIPHEVIGTGIEPPAEPPSAERFRKATGITKPFLLYFGRIVESKGVDELLAMWAKLRERPGAPDWDLVLAGKAEMPIPSRADVHDVGFVDERTKWDMLAAASAVVVPSRLESLSIVLLEAWWCGKPALVHAECAPVAGQVRRASGGLLYARGAEFAESLGLLAEDGALRDRLGSAGRDYVRRTYDWPVIVEKYLDLFAEMRYST